MILISNAGCRYKYAGILHYRGSAKAPGNVLKINF